MPALEVDHAALLRLVWGLNGQDTAINVLGVHNPSNTEITQGMADSLGAAIKTAFTTSGQAAHIHPNVSLSRVGIRAIHDPNLPEFTDGGDQVQGVGTGFLLPPQTCLVVTLRTAFAGRSFRGRSYLWGYSSDSNTFLGVAASAAGTAAKAFIDAINTALAAPGFALAVVSRPVYSDADPPILIRPGFVNAVTLTMVRDLVWDTQRRRSIPGV
jgi:hypothetical protein